MEMIKIFEEYNLTFKNENNYIEELIVLFLSEWRTKVKAPYYKLIFKLNLTLH